MASGSRRQRELARQHYLRQQERRRAHHETVVRRRRLIAAVVLAVVGVVAVVGVAAWLGSRGSQDTTTAQPPVAGACAWTPSGDAAGGTDVAPPPTNPDTTGSSTAAIALGALGTVDVRLDAARAPCAVTSFRHLASVGYFTGTPCHRLTASSTLKVLQCGDPTGSGSGGPGYTFPDEGLASATYPAGTLAMANSGANTNGSQFFLVYADSTLPPQYTPFGQITGGLERLRAIAAKGVQGGGQDGKPVEPVVISGVTVAPPVVGSTPDATPTPTPTPTPS